MCGVFLWEDLEYTESPESSFVLERRRASHVVLSGISSDSCPGLQLRAWGQVNLALWPPEGLPASGRPPVGVLGDTCVPLGGGGASVAQLSHALWLNCGPTRNFQSSASGCAPG